MEPKTLVRPRQAETSFEVTEERFDKVRADDKVQVIDLLLSESSKRGWPTAVSKHSFDKWLTGAGDQKELETKWLKHEHWRCVYVMVQETVVAVALLAHDDAKPSAVILTFLCARAHVSEEGERTGGFGAILLKDVSRRFHSGDFDNIVSYSAKGEAAARRLIIETDTEEKLGKEMWKFLHDYYSTQLGEMGMTFEYSVESGKHIWTVPQELVQNKRRRRSITSDTSHWF